MELQTAPERNEAGPEWTQPGPDRHQTGPEGNETGPERITAAAAAQLLGVTDRTLRKWAREGRLTREFGADGHPWYSLAEVEALSRGAFGQPADSGPERLRVRSGSASTPGRNGSRPDRTGTSPEWHGTGPDSPAMGPLNQPRHAMSPDAAGPFHTETILSHRAELAERERDMLQAERDQQQGEVEHLRAQLEVRADELSRRDQAEGELRKLLAMSQHALQCALERPALPPAPDTQAPTPKKARWWAPWRR